jgi:hypothetical protein
MLLQCKNDPLVDTLRKTFRAVPIRVPEARVAPLVVFLLQGGRFHFAGPLQDLVTTRTAARLAELDPKPSPMADLKETRSGDVDVDLGLKILDGFLRGFSVSGCLPAVKAQFAQVVSVSFAFLHVERSAVPLTAIGRVLVDRAFEVQHPLINDALSRVDRPEFFVVDSTIASRDFTITASTKSAAELKLQAAKIQDLVDVSAKVKVTSKSKRELTFAGPQQLPFAFTCCRVNFDKSGGDIRLAPYVGKAAFARPGRANEEPLQNAVPTSHVELVEWE